MNDKKNSGSKTESQTEPKVIIFHGLTNEEAAKFMRLIKENAEDSSKLIFAITTEHSINWKVKDLIAELQKEHEYFKDREREE